MLSGLLAVAVVGNTLAFHTLVTDNRGGLGRWVGGVVWGVVGGVG